jgi:hypothetical protein
VFVFAVVVGLLALTVVLCFLAYLRFCRFVVIKTGSTAGLRDVAVAMRAFAALPLPRSRSK